ncbi:MAG TPA: preprotein translocase subunit SecA, partial [bacterium]|nr:preprotein translocase subunit SecA [bacterium]
MGIWDKIFGDPNLKIIKSLQPTIDKINSLEGEYQKKSLEELKEKTFELKKRLGSFEGEEKKYSPEEEQELLNEVLPEAFANIREASSRILGQRHYDVQLVGGIVLHRGQIAEMKTGEGKTLVATLPLYLNALLGKGVHLVTVNDYLSKVGAGWMAPLYYSLGLSTGVIVHNTAFVYDPSVSNENEYDPRLKPFREVSRGEAYKCDITYGT